jgi:hypothetical protein
LVRADTALSATGAHGYSPQTSSDAAGRIVHPLQGAIRNLNPAVQSPAP